MIESLKPQNTYSILPQSHVYLFLKYYDKQIPAS